jgi:hypothetical protein
MAIVLNGPAPTGGQDLTGKTFGRWFIVRYDHSKRYGAKIAPYWLCRCVCGKQKIVEGNSIVFGKSTSCGCRQKEIVTTHGMSRGPSTHFLYSTWKSMLNRCRTKTHHKFQHYGARGITVDSRWDSFEAFLEDMLPTWKPNTTLDRENNDGNYCKSNCRWATKETQANNTRRNRFLTKGRITLTMAQWARKTGIPAATISRRIQAGWIDGDAVTR